MGRCDGSYSTIFNEGLSPELLRCDRQAGENSIDETVRYRGQVPPVVLSWLPGADNCRNFSERFTFCPESLKRRAKRAGSDTPKKQYQHPLLLAYEFQELLEAGVVNNRAEIARHCGLSRARVTQVMSLLQLPDDIQEYVMALPTEMQRSYSGRRLQGVAGIRDEAAQGKAFEDLVKKVSETAES